VLNTNALSTWQDWLVAVTIVFTLAGSLLAATVFDLIPPLRTAQGPLTPTRSGVGALANDERSTLPAAQRSNIAAHRSTLAFVLGTACAWVLTRRRSRD
jgi:ABC-type spermidine/putrescine transport system permease subunit II